MEAQVRAGIDLYERSLRYAEVEQYGEQHRLLRLGSCDFDFDVTDTLLRTGATEELETIAEALQDIYDGSSARALQVVVHPSHVHSFSAPAPADESDEARRERFRREAALLTRGEEAVPGASPASAPASAGAATAPFGEAAPDEESFDEERSDGALHLATEDLYTETRAENGEERVEWFHVLALPRATQERFERVLRALPQPSFRWTISMQAAARAAAALMHRPDDFAPEAPPAEASYTLAVGRYGEHVELALSRDWRWRFGLHAPTAAPSDSAYYAAALLDQLGLAPDAVGRVFLYGQQADPDIYSLLERLFGRRPERFDFMPILDLDPDSVATDFEMGLYIPCIGAAL